MLCEHQIGNLCLSKKNWGFVDKKASYFLKKYDETKKPVFLSLGKSLKKATELEFEKAINNEDNKRIINGALKRYFKQKIDQDDRQSMIMDIIWSALKTHQNGIQKFTSTLYCYTEWFCKTEFKKRKKKNERNEKCSDQLNLFYAKPIDDLSGINDLMVFLSQKHQIIVKGYVLENKTFEELGKELKCSDSMVKNEYVWALGRLKNLMQDAV